MKDIGGIECKEGDFVQVTFNPNLPPLNGWVHKLKEGGLIVAHNPTERGGTILSEVYIISRIILADAQPGSNHPSIRRIPNPETEMVVPKSGGNA